MRLKFFFPAEGWPFCFGLSVLVNQGFVTHMSVTRTCHSTAPALLLLWCPVFTLTQWGRMTHICVSKPTIIGSDNGLSPGRCRAIIRTSAGILLIGPLGTNFSETLIRIQTFSLKENTFETVVWKMTAILSRPQYVKSSYCSLFDDRATVPAPDLQMHYRNVLRPANERRCYDVTPSLVGWAKT